MSGQMLGAALGGALCGGASVAACCLLKEKTIPPRHGREDEADEHPQEFQPFKPVERVVVYGSSAALLDPSYGSVALQLGDVIAKRGWLQVNGGGAVGLMGAATDGGLRAGGVVDCVILDKFADYRHPGLRNVDVRVTMPSRKKGLYDAGDAYIALPGGLGTLEEVLEVLSWRQLGFHDKPVVFINTNGFYTRVEDMFSSMIAQGFVSDRIRSSYLFTTSPYEAIRFIDQYTPQHIDKAAIHKGDIRTDWEAAAAAGLNALPVTAPVRYTFRRGMRVQLTQSLGLQKSRRTLNVGHPGTVAKVPGEMPGTVAEVDFDDGPLVDVYPGTIEPSAIPPLRRQYSNSASPTPSSPGHNPHSPSRRAPPATAGSESTSLNSSLHNATLNSSLHRSTVVHNVASAHPPASPAGSPAAPQRADQPEPAATPEPAAAPEQREATPPEQTDGPEVPAEDEAAPEPAPEANGAADEGASPASTD
ncbi:putative cytokinin riboside 5prime-monophosphate phosphoribohydrolase LOGL1 [Diplonema papillatum]|nr:putative cytokinin riboside 5prime-monophosphate phosphoribohydrolase LOGL1 [Diplonema papillatum]